MIDAQPIAVVNDYPGLQRAMRARAEALQISRATLDALAGTHDGHAGKMLADPPTKNMGLLTFGLLLQGLGLKLIVAEDVEQMAKIAHRLEHRDPKNGSVLAIATSAPIEIRISRRTLRKRGALGGLARAANLSERDRVRIARNAGKARASKMTPKERSESARIAARARWKGNRPKKPA